MDRLHTAMGPEHCVVSGKAPAYPRHADQMVRGVVSLPHGTGKDMKVLALVTPDKEQEAKDAGADFVGLDEYLDKIKSGWSSGRSDGSSSGQWRKA